MLLSVSIIAITMVAVARTFAEGLTYESNSNATRDAFDDRIRFEDEMTRLLEGITLHAATAYLVSPVTQSASSANTPTAPKTDNSTNELGKGASDICFTTSGIATPQEFLKQTGADFATLNRKFGPQGGLAETELSITPVGDAGDLKGLFLRTQRPPDSDPTQGGEETLLAQNLRDIRFEFYDGTDWQTSWDSRNGNKDKLPDAIRVTYLFPQDRLPHSFVVRLLLKDAGPVSNPGAGSTNNQTPNGQNPNGQPANSNQAPGGTQTAPTVPSGGASPATGGGN
jgi:hypothetical protein